MADYFEFVEFFDKMGIEYSQHENKYAFRHGNEPQKSKYNLIVSQAIFCFDCNRKYIGVVADELGNFVPRRAHNA